MAQGANGQKQILQGIVQGAADPPKASNITFSAYKTHLNLVDSLLPKSAVEEAFRHINWSDVRYYVTRTEFEQGPVNHINQLTEEQLALLKESQMHPMEYVLANVTGNSKSCLEKAQLLVQTCIQFITLTGYIIFCDDQASTSPRQQGKNQKQRRKIPSKKISQFTCGCQSRLARPYLSSQSSNVSEPSEPLVTNGRITPTRSYSESHPMITEAQYAAAHEAELIMLVESDPLGVLVHWCVQTLYCIVVCLLEANNVPGATDRSGGSLKASTGEKITLAAILLHKTNKPNRMTSATLFIELMKALRACPKYDSYVSTTLGYVAAQMILALSTKERGIRQVSDQVLDLDLHAFGPGDGVRVRQLAEELISWSCEMLSQSSAPPGPATTSTCGTSLDVVMPSLLTLLSDDKMSRQIFIAHGGIGYVSKHLRRYTPSKTSSNTPSFKSSAVIPQPVEVNMDIQRCDSVEGVIRRPNAAGKSQPQDAPPVSKYINPGSPSKAKPPTSNGSLDSPTKAEPTSSMSTRLGVAPLSDASYSAIVAGSNKGRSSFTSTVSATFTPSSASFASSITTSSKTQQLYHLVFCLWAITLELLDPTSLDEAHILTRDRLVQRVASDGAIPALCGLVRSRPREKVVRVAIKCLVNLAAASDRDLYRHSGYLPRNETIFVKEMLACGLGLTLKNLSEGSGPIATPENATDKSKKPGNTRIKDEQVRDNIEQLMNTLAEHESATTTQWDIYVTEVESGLLSWSSGLHTEKFFRQNCMRLEGPNSDFYLVKLLFLHISGHSSQKNSFSSIGVDEEVLAVALFDVGEFVRHYPNGRLIAKQLGITPFVMQLLNHESHEVQQHALQCVSKLLVNSRHMLT